MVWSCGRSELRKTMDEDGSKPVVRILHHMARSGGTVIAKCLGSMDGVVLLSEIHPAGTRYFNPLQQAHQWFGLLTPGDLRRLQTGGTVDFRDAISLIAERCSTKGKVLLLRDWSHLDFTAVPFLPEPSYRLTLAEVLAERFRVVHTASVRHPIDQWLSLRRLPLLQGKISVGEFLRGYARFSEHCIDIGFVRYEDFTVDPDAQLRTLCERLRLRYDPGYRGRWAAYQKVTGDRQGNRSQREIKPLPRQAMEPGLLEALESNADYLHALELLGYRHPQ
jgi:hypothetical protein